MKRTDNQDLKRVKELAVRLARFYGLIRAGRRSVDENRVKDLELACFYLTLAEKKKVPKYIKTVTRPGLVWFQRGAEYYRRLPTGIGTERAAENARAELKPFLVGDPQDIVCPECGGELSMSTSHYAPNTPRYLCDSCGWLGSASDIRTGKVATDA